MIDVQVLGGPHDGTLLRATDQAPTVTILTRSDTPCPIHDGRVHPGYVVAVLPVEHTTDGRHIAHWPREGAHA